MQGRLRLHVEVDLLRLGRPQHKSQKKQSKSSTRDLYLPGHDSGGASHLFVAASSCASFQSAKPAWSLPNKPPSITIAFQNVNPDSPLRHGTRIQAGCYKVEHWSLPSMIATCGDLSRQSKTRERAVIFPDYTELGPSMSSSGFTALCALLFVNLAGLRGLVEQPHCGPLR